MSTTGLKGYDSNGYECSLSPEQQQAKDTLLVQINEVRQLIGPLSGKLALFCSDASISRYLRARNWNIKKAVKLLKASLKWRLEYKPEDIRWNDVAAEAETGKIYRSSYKDKYGRPVLVLRPRCQNTKLVEGQIKFLVYCMENAIVNLPEDQEQMVWLIDFQGFSMSNISMKVTRETTNVLQEHYPERLGAAILYNAPKIFEPFWTVVKPFLEAKTANKVNFVYSDNSHTSKIMEKLFDMELVESAFGGKDSADFNFAKYAERMREDDKKLHSFWNRADSTPLTAALHSLSLETSTSESDTDESGVKPGKSEDCGAIEASSLPPKQS